MKCHLYVTIYQVNLGHPGPFQSSSSISSETEPLWTSGPSCHPTKSVKAQTKYKKSMKNTFLTLLCKQKCLQSCAKLITEHI